MSDTTRHESSAESRLHCCDCDAVKYGYDHCCTVPHGDRLVVRGILTDLITELLSGDWETYTAGGGPIRMKADGWQKIAAERAEQRLREVSGE